MKPYQALVGQVRERGSTVETPFGRLAEIVVQVHKETNSRILINKLWNSKSGLESMYDVCREGNAVTVEVVPQGTEI